MVHELNTDLMELSGPGSDENVRAGLWWSALLDRILWARLTKNVRAGLWCSALACGGACHFLGATVGYLLNGRPVRYFSIQLIIHNGF